MTSPPEDIIVKCPNCNNVYKDWHRASFNLGLEDFDEEYMDEATSSTCPNCKFKVKHEVLIVRKDGVWET
jgi:endogenous inhibitor of DNA gyrase (YacG/DUF329 family)